MKEIYKKKMEERDAAKKAAMEKMLKASCSDGVAPKCADGTDPVKESKEEKELKDMDEATMKKRFKEKIDEMDKPDKDGRKMGGEEMKKKLMGMSKEDFKKDIDT